MLGALCARFGVYIRGSHARPQAPASNREQTKSRRSGSHHPGQEAAIAGPNFGSASAPPDPEDIRTKDDRRAPQPVTGAALGPPRHVGVRRGMRPARAAHGSSLNRRQLPLDESRRGGRGFVLCVATTRPQSHSDALLEGDRARRTRARGRRRRPAKHASGAEETCTLNRSWLYRAGESLAVTRRLPRRTRHAHRRGATGTPVNGLRRRALAGWSSPMKCLTQPAGATAGASER